jgi:hypothetical protein
VEAIRKFPGKLPYIDTVMVYSNDIHFIIHLAFSFLFRPGIRYDPLVPDLSGVDPGRVIHPTASIPPRSRLPGEPNPDNLAPPQFEYDYYG